jgi:hypothetical protein
MMLARYDNVGCTLRMQCHGVDGHNLQVVDGEIDGDDLCPFYAQRHRQSDGKENFLASHVSTIRYTCDMSILCIYHAHELTIFIKNMKKSYIFFQLHFISI